MLEEKANIEKVAIVLPVKLSIVSDITEISEIYSAKTRLISLTGLLVEITSNCIVPIKEGDKGTGTLSYKRHLFYSDCQILRVKGTLVIIRFIDPEFERVMVLKRIIENNA